MASPFSRAWRAVRVPTFRMRIAQALVIVIVIVTATIALGLVVVARTAGSRIEAENAGRMLTVAQGLEGGIEAQRSAVDALVEGNIKDADVLFNRGQEKALEFNRELKAADDDEHRDDILAEAEAVDGYSAEAGGLFGRMRSLVASGGSQAQVEVTRTQVERSFDQADTIISDLRKLADADLNRSVAESRRAYRFGVIGFIVCFAATVLLGFLAMSGTYRGITRTLRKVIHQVDDIASGRGDLTALVEVPTKDVMGELADSINAMVASLRNTTVDIRDVSEELIRSAETLARSIESISASIEEMVSSADQISAGTAEQAGKVEETSQAAGKVSRSAETIAKEVRVSAQQSSLTADLAERGGEAAGETVAAMREIYDSVMNSQELMEGLGERFTQIGVIIEVITDISDQTNLLALNAAIEAARAGEHGRGFAVVAGEVRKLAESSKRSAEQISRLIREMTRETGRVVSSMNADASRVELGRGVAENAGEALAAIVESSRAAAKAVDEISAAIQSIAAGTDSVFEATSEIAAIAQQAAGSVEEVSATLNEERVAIDELSEAALALAFLSARLQELTEGFKIA